MNNTNNAPQVEMRDPATVQDSPQVNVVSTEEALPEPHIDARLDGPFSRLQGSLSKVGAVHEQQSSE